MKQESRQFGVFALFVLTTAAAGIFAIVRLPLPLVSKMLMIQTIAVCFLGCAVRNRKYPDPRIPQEQTPKQVMLSLVPSLVFGIGCIVFSLLVYFRVNGP